MIQIQFFLKFGSGSIESPMLKGKVADFGYKSFVPTLAKNVLFHKCESVKTGFSISHQKLKAPYHTIEQNIK